jgi:serine/threonine protein kinase
MCWVLEVKISTAGQPSGFRHWEQIHAHLVTHTSCNTKKTYHLVCCTQLSYVKSVLLSCLLLSDTQVDVWSAGVVCFEVLTGRAPFAAENVAQVLQVCVCVCQHAVRADAHVTRPQTNRRFCCPAHGHCQQLHTDCCLTAHLQEGLLSFNTHLKPCLPLPCVSVYRPSCTASWCTPGTCHQTQLPSCQLHSQETPRHGPQSGSCCSTPLSTCTRLAGAAAAAATSSSRRHSSSCPQSGICCSTPDSSCTRAAAAAAAGTAVGATARVGDRAAAEVS